MNKPKKPGKRLLKAGDKVGSLTVIQYVADDPNPTSPIMKVRLRVECVCGKRETIPQFYITRPKPKTSCGCQNKSLQTVEFLTYRSWYMMQVRCYDPKHEAYSYYGGRGITVCPQWRDPNTGFEQFFKDMGRRPSQKLSIDRFPNNDGNYEPGNCRWATAKQQRENQRVRKS